MDSTPQPAKIHSFSFGQDKTAYYIGPDISEGPLPAFYYFALSGKESLELDPFNQPALFLDHRKLRVFSLDIPGHDKPVAQTDAIAFWAKAMQDSADPIGAFAQSVRELTDRLVESNVIDPDHLAAGGLSRGGFIAAHCAAVDPRIQSVLGFAPLTRPAYQKEFHSIASNPSVQKLALDHLADTLYNRSIRFYIGNRDIRVGTKNCYEVVEHWTETAFSRKIRSPQIELIINPSIGHQGHGTAPEVFRSGADWIQAQLTAKDS